MDVSKMSKLAERMTMIPPSGTIQMMEKAKALEADGTKVFHLDIGEPDFATPQLIIDSAVDALNSGKTKYTSSRGIPQLRLAISDYLKKRNLTYNPQTEILATPGSKHSLYTVIQAIVNPSDEVIAITPAWPTYFSLIGSASAKTVEVPTEHGMKLDVELLKESISPKTKLIMINSPSNPTGGGFGQSELKAIADLATDHDFFVLTDEVYNEITYDDFAHVSIATLPDMWDRTIVVDGFSKTFSMTGWRLGYLAGPAEIVKGATIVQQASTSCPAAFSQHAGVTALTHPELPAIVQGMVEQYKERRDFVYNVLSQIDGVECAKPVGAFYLFIQYPTKLGKSSDVAQDILMKTHTSTTPGSAFGVQGEHHLRLSYATSMDILKQGVQNVKEFIETS